MEQQPVLPLLYYIMVYETGFPPPKEEVRLAKRPHRRSEQRVFE